MDGIPGCVVLMGWASATQEACQQPGVRPDRG